MLASDAFRHSKQPERLLRYLVENSLEDHDELLRERAIGAHLFGREPKYDTNEDSIVRVCANELRKRLARYYLESGADSSLRLTVPVGSYRVEFQVQGKPETLPPQEQTPVPPPVWPRAALVVGVPVILVTTAYLLWPASAISQFWGPALADKNPVVILAPHPIVYNFTRDLHRRFRGNDPSHAQRMMEPLTAPPDSTIAWKDVVIIKDQYIGLGSAHAIAQLTSLFTSRHKASDIRFGGDSSFQDIRSAPAVLIGAYANRWTLQLTDELRFILADKDGVPEIRDRTNGKAWTLRRLDIDGTTSEDYVIVSRIFHPKTGRLMVALAGITQYGTQAGGEFVTDPGQLADALRDAPTGWSRKNVQFLLHIPVVERVPGRPTVLASHYW